MTRVALNQTIRPAPGGRTLIALDGSLCEFSKCDARKNRLIELKHLDGLAHISLTGKS